MYLCTDAELQKSSEDTVANMPASLPPDIISSSFGVDLTSTFDEVKKNLPEQDNSVMVFRPSLLDQPSFQIQSGRSSECDVHNQLSNLDQPGYLNQGCNVGCVDQSPDHDSYRKESEETLAKDLEKFVTNISKLSLPILLDGLEETAPLASKQTASAVMETWTLQDLSKEAESGKLTCIYAAPKVDDNKSIMPGTSSSVSGEICPLLKQSELCKDSVIEQPCRKSDLTFRHSYGIWPNVDLCSEHLKEEHNSVPERLVTEKIESSLAGLGTGLVQSFNPTVMEVSQENGAFKSESTAVLLATVGNGKAEAEERTSLCCVRSQESLVSDMRSKLVKEDVVTVDSQSMKDEVFGLVLQDDVISGSLNDNVISGSQKGHIISGSPMDDVTSGSWKDGDISIAEEKIPLSVSANDVLCKNVPSAASDKLAVSSNTHSTSMEEQKEKKTRRNKAHLADSASKTDHCIVTSAMSFTAPCSGMSRQSQIDQCRGGWFKPAPGGHFNYNEKSLVFLNDLQQVLIEDFYTAC